MLFMAPAITLGLNSDYLDNNIEVFILLKIFTTAEPLNEDDS
jgi:hypothetical protein